MKKILTLLFVFVIVISLLVACDQTPTKPSENTGSDSTTATTAPDETTGGDSTTATTAPDETTGGDGTTATTAPEETTGGDSTTATTDGGDLPVPPSYKYNDFTPQEKTVLTELMGETVPFLPNTDYGFEVLSDEYGTVINFYTFGNSEEEFTAYRASFVGYTLTETILDDYGDTWYFYEKGDICIHIGYYEFEGENVVDAYIYLLEEEGGNGGGGTTPPDPTYLYTEFTATDIAIFEEIVGEAIPFIPNNEYYVKSLSDEYGPYVNFYTFGNTEAEFDAYLKALVGYTLSDSEVDEYGDTIYYYEKGNICIQISYYLYDGEYIVDAYIYLLDGEGGEDSEGGGSTTPEDADVITNDGKGLPTDADGVYDVDFTKATNVKDVTDQGYYIDGCPTVGSPAVLVIPVDFMDATAKDRGFDLSKLSKAFASNDPNDNIWSVYEYYALSSYGKLTLDFTVLDEWFRPKYNSDYYANATDADGYANGDQLIIDEALAYLATVMDLSVFDSDGNSIIDAIIVVHTLEIDSSTDFYWAYRYWNYHTDGDGYYYEYDGVSANDYVWASFDFLHESYDENNNVDYSDKTVMNTYTFIHEFGHVLGADDYYDTSYSSDDTPLAGLDIMDGMMGDHNAYTKFNLGWLTNSRLVVCEESITLTLEAFAKNGDTIIIANNWDDALGAYQEYYVIVYYTAEGLNAGEGGYFVRDGIIVYHVNASLCKEIYNGEIYYLVYNNNTDASDEYGTVNNLIEYVKSDADTYTYIEGDTMEATYDDAGNAPIYNFVVDSISDGIATLTFTKVA